MVRIIRGSCAPPKKLFWFVLRQTLELLSPPASNADAVLDAYPPPPSGNLKHTLDLMPLAPLTSCGVLRVGGASAFSNFLWSSCHTLCLSQLSARPCCTRTCSRNVDLCHASVVNDQ